MFDMLYKLVFRIPRKKKYLLNFSYSKLISSIIDECILATYEVNKYLVDLNWTNTLFVLEEKGDVYKETPFTAYVNMTSDDLSPVTNDIINGYYDEAVINYFPVQSLYHDFCNVLKQMIYDCGKVDKILINYSVIAGTLLIECEV